MPGQKDILIWSRLRNWLQSAKRLASPEEAAEFFLDQLEDEISQLEMEMEMEPAGGGQRVGFCHNDLQYGNLMMDEETRLVTIIVRSSPSFLIWEGIHSPVALTFPWFFFFSPLLLARTTNMRATTRSRTTWPTISARWPRTITPRRPTSWTSPNTRVSRRLPDRGVDF